VSRLIIGLQYAEELSQITRQELEQLVICLQTQLPKLFTETHTLAVADLTDGDNVALLDAANVFTGNQTIAKARPALILKHTAATALGRVMQLIDNGLYLSQNISFDGTDYNLDDTTKAGMLLTLYNGKLYLVNYPAGANPISGSAHTILQAGEDGGASAGLLDLLCGQLKFPATQIASANANTLDDYEEGSWTPIDGSSAALTYVSQSGHYAKIGSLVYVSGAAQYPVTASGVAAKIGGLPFTVSGIPGAGSPGFTNATLDLLYYIAQNTTKVELYLNTGAAVTNVQVSAATCVFAGCYRASA
jgi:hypothetical protein